MSQVIDSIKENVKLRGVKDILNPKRWWMFIHSKASMWLGKDPDEEIAWAEQIVYRQSRCSQCVEAGKCVHCGCPMNELLTEKSAACSALQWGPAMSAPTWETYKESNKINLYVT